MRGSLRAYARHRKQAGLPGGSLAAVQGAIQRGRIRLIDGLVDFDRADREWQANSDQRKQRKIKTLNQKPDKGFSKPQGTADESFAEAQRKREWLRVRREQLELDKLSGALIDVAEVEVAVFNRARAERDALLAWPSRISSDLAARLQVSESQLRGLLDAEVRAFLVERSGAESPLFLQEQST